MSIWHLFRREDVRQTNDYRIIDVMGVYYAQRRHVTVAGKDRWVYETERWDHNERWLGRTDLLEMRRLLRTIIAERKRHQELEKRGPVVVEMMRERAHR